MQTLLASSSTASHQNIHNIFAQLSHSTKRERKEEISPNFIPQQRKFHNLSTFVLPFFVYLKLPFLHFTLTHTHTNTQRILTHTKRERKRREREREKKRGKCTVQYWLLTVHQPYPKKKLCSSNDNGKMCSERK